MVTKTRQSLRNFKLWESYNQNEKALFWGRDQEIKNLYNKTFSSNLLLLYGAGGAGKTSMIRCGLGNMFEESDWYPIFIRKGNNIIQSLSRALRNETGHPDKLRNNSIKEKIHELFLEKFRPIYLIFDQFEELFILGDKNEQDQFFRLLLELLNVNFQCKIILCIKEDYLADLDPYEEVIPVLFYNRMRLERMRREQLEEVIRGMTRELNIRLGDPENLYLEQEQEDIINAIIKKVKGRYHQWVDLDELQVFMDELYVRDATRREEEDIPERAICFSRKLVEQTEYVDDLITRRLQQQLEALDQDFHQKYGLKRFPYLILQNLITDSETKHMRTVGEIANQLIKKHNVTPEQVQDCVDMLSEENLIKKLSENGRNKDKLPLGIQVDQKVEIIHDNLAKKLYPLLFTEEHHLMKIKTSILNQYEYYQKTGVLLDQKGLEYISPYLKEVLPKLDPAQQQFVSDSQKAVKKRFLKGFLSITGVFILLSFCAGIALFQAWRSTRISEANHIVAQATDAFSFDRTLALRLAEKALEKDPGNRLANNVLNDVLIHSWEYPFYQEAIAIHSKEMEIDRLSDLDISKYNRYLLAGSLDGQIYIQDLSSLDTQLGIRAIDGGHEGEITDVDFVGDYPGTDFYFFTSSKDGTARFWRIVNGSRDTAKTERVYQHGEPLAAVAMVFSGTDTLVITAGDRQLKLWDYQVTDSSYLSYETLQTTAFEYVANPKGQFLFIAGRDSTLQLVRIDKERREFRKVFDYKINEGAVVSMDFDSDRLVAGLNNGLLVSWKVDQALFPDRGNKTNLKFSMEGQVSSKKAHAEAIKDVVILKGSHQILTSSSDKSAKLWDAEINLLKTFLGHNDGVHTIVTSEDERFVYTGGADKTIKKWALELPAYTPNTIPDLQNVKSVELVPDEDWLFVRTASNELVYYEKVAWEKYHWREKLSAEDLLPFTDITVSSNGRQILLAKECVAEVRYVNGDILDSLHHCETGNTAGVAFSQDDEFALTYGDTLIRIWQRNLSQNSYTSYASIPRHDQVVRAVVANIGNGEDPKPAVLAAVQEGAKAYLWVDGEPTEVDHQDAVLDLAFSRDGKYFLTSSQDNSFFIGETENPGDIRRIQRHDADVNCVAFSPGIDKKRQFLTADENGSVRLWSLDDAGKLKEQNSIINHGAPIVDAFFLAENQILTLGNDGRIKIWNTGELTSFMSENIYRLKDEDIAFWLDAH